VSDDVCGGAQHSSKRFAPWSYSPSCTFSTTRFEIYEPWQEIGRGATVSGVGTTIFYRGSPFGLRTYLLVRNVRSFERYNSYVHFGYHTHKRPNEFYESSHKRYRYVDLLSCEYNRIIERFLLRFSYVGVDT
jgi:hypothetical protein